MFLNWSGLCCTVNLNEEMLTGFGFWSAKKDILRAWLFLLQLMEKDPAH